MYRINLKLHKDLIINTLKTNVRRMRMCFRWIWDTKMHTRMT